MRGVAIRRWSLPLSLAVLGLSVVAPLPTHAGWPKKLTTNASRLAESIDTLEQHIEQYGSVVPKQPDVWGQARLAKYRRMVEQELETRKDDFVETINATIVRSDQASLVNSLALRAAISGPQSVVTKKGGSTVVNTSSATEQTTSTSNEVLQPPDFAAVPSAESFGLPAITSSPRAESQFKNLNQGVALEPTVMLDQLTTYLNHLNQLRRTNEGDDTADAPGYALHLVRIPVSVLPGKKTREGYSAEVTFTVEPVINENLLPTVFRSLVTNDVTDQMAALIFDHKDKDFDLLRKAQQAADETEVPHEHSQPVIEGSPAPGATTQESLESVSPKSVKGSPFEPKSTLMQALENKYGNFKPNEKPNEFVDRILQRTVISTAGPSTAQSPSPSATKLLSDIFDLDMLEAVASLANYSEVTNPVGDRIKNTLILDLRKIAVQRVQTAYDLLKHPNSHSLWSCGAALHQAILYNNRNTIKDIRNSFVKDIKELSNGGLEDRKDPVIAFAWAILYQSVLLNQQLLEDMKSVAIDKGADCHPGDMPLDLYLPNPVPGAAELFGSYVRARWPIHVFAIDPMTSDQNIADTFSRRRDMQLSLALAFSSGAISAQNFTRFARRLELDMESIALNRTQVGFSHGDDTFGWRFYPRVQSPPIESNAKVFFRDLMIGGPNRDCELNTMRLEAGARECVALVIMPSFVPYVRFDSRTNWFKLSNPKHKEFDLKTNVILGTQITCLRENAMACQQDRMTRGTDLALLMRSVDQLEKRLPLQTCLAQVPFELTDSGHNVFNHGVSDLGPSLRGYYGEPGIAGKENAIVVIGENFSITDTKVVAGNKLLDNDTAVELLSRQVMVLKIPDDAVIDNSTIDIHVATPYGVSNHLAVQLPKAAPAPAWQLSQSGAICTYAINHNQNPDQIGYYRVVSYTPAVIAQSKTQPSGFVKVRFSGGDFGPIVCNTRKVPSGYTIDIKTLGQAILNHLIANNLVDPTSPPEGAPYKLNVELSDDGGVTFQKLTATTLIINFRLQPELLPTASTGSPRAGNVQHQKVQVRVGPSPRATRRPAATRHAMPMQPRKNAAPQPPEPVLESTPDEEPEPTAEPDSEAGEGTSFRTRRPSRGTVPVTEPVTEVVSELNGPALQEDEFTDVNDSELIDE